MRFVCYTYAMPKHTPPVTDTIDIDAVFASDETLAAYLATLTPTQVEHVRAVILAAPTMSEPMKESLVRLMNIVYVEARKNVTELEATVLPLATGIATALTLQDQIKELEALAASLDIPLSA
jgi:hypothetical protein